MNPEKLLLFDSATAIDGEPPKSFPVLRYGKAKYTKGGEPGELEFSMADAQSVVKEFLERGKDLVIDYEHQTLSGGEAPASGWVKSLRAEPDGLYADVEWTDRAATLMRGREYRYFSPVVQQTRRNKTLHSIALTNHPALHNIPALVADDLQGAAKGSDGIDDIEIVKNDENLNENGDYTMEKLKKLAMQIGVAIPEDCTEDGAWEAVTSGITGMIERNKSAEAAKAGMVAMTDHMIVKRELDGLRAQQRHDKAVAAVKAGMDQRKLMPNMEKWAMQQAENDLAAFNDFLSIAPEVVPPTPAAPSTNVPANVSSPLNSVKTLALTDTQRKIAKGLNLTEEAFLKSLQEGK